MIVQTKQHEDYLERILEILQEKGSVRSVEVAERLGVSKGSVSQMIQRLEVEGYLLREKYRGFSLTAKGKATAQKIQRRHLVLSEFLTLIGVPLTTQEKDIEGLEHSVSSDTLDALEKLIRYLQKKGYKKNGI